MKRMYNLSSKNINIIFISPRSIMPAIMTALLVILCGCTSEPVFETHEDDLIQLQFKPMLQTNNTETRAIEQYIFLDDILQAKDKNSVDLGIWISTNDILFTPYSHGMDNMKSTYEHKSNDKWLFNYGDNTHSQIGIKSGIPLNIYAYFPHTEYPMGEKFTPEAVPFKSGYNDIIWATPVYIENLAHNAATHNRYDVELKFHHAMTCIEIRMYNKLPGTVALREASLIDNNYTEGKEGMLYGSGTIDITTEEGILNFNDDDIAETIKLEFSPAISIYNDENNKRSIYFILPPISNYSDGLMSIKLMLDGTEKTYSLPCCKDKDGAIVKSFERAKRYIYELEINNENSFIAPFIIEEGWTKNKEIKFEL